MIGIKYDLLRVPQPADPVKAIQRPVRKSPPKAEVEEEKPKPEVPRFQVTVRSVVTMEDEREVEAATARQAGETALGLVAREKGEPAAVKLSRKVVRVRRL